MHIIYTVQPIMASCYIYSMYRGTFRMTIRDVANISWTPLDAIKHRSKIVNRVFAYVEHDSAIKKMSIPSDVVWNCQQFCRYVCSFPSFSSTCLTCWLFFSDSWGQEQSAFPGIALGSWALSWGHEADMPITRGNQEQGVRLVAKYIYFLCLTSCLQEDQCHVFMWTNYLILAHNIFTTFLYLPKIMTSRGPSGGFIVAWTQWHRHNGRSIFPP